MTKSFAAVLLLTSALAAPLFRVGVISDSHFNEYYDPNTSANMCTYQEGVTPIEAYAPLSRYGCDPSENLIDLMYTRFTEAFGDVDFIIVPGDSAAHDVAAEPGDDPYGTHYTAVKNNIEATFAKFAEHFPGKTILPTFGNNDGRYHNEAIDEPDKQNYYSFVYDIWFS